jgi:N-acetylglutamate synthase-like GNAT family acetyltransferase
MEATRGAAYPPPMHTVPAIRRATPADAPALTILLHDLGYPVEPDGVDATLRQVLDDPGAFVVVAADDEHGVVGFLSLSCRPVLRLEGVAGTIEELAVRSDVRAHGVGDRLVQYAKGLASERGWVRLETAIARMREVNRGDFFDSRGFSRGDCVTYRWSRLESRHPTLPALDRSRRRHELV